MMVMEKRSLAIGK